MDAVPLLPPALQGGPLRPPVACNSLEGLQSGLRLLIGDTSSAFIPPLVTGDFYIGPHVIIRTTRPADARDAQFGAADGHDTPRAGRAKSGAKGKHVEVDVALAPLLIEEATTSLEHIRQQRMITRAVINAIGEVDGYGYGMRTEWLTKKNGRCFLYACSDSLQNKDRAANIKRNQAKEADGSQDAQGSKKLPTYNCGGAIKIKFCFDPPQLHVSYAHAAIHRPLVSRMKPIPIPLPLDPRLDGTAARLGMASWDAVLPSIQPMDGLHMTRHGMPAAPGLMLPGLTLPMQRVGNGNGPIPNMIGDIPTGLAKQMPISNPYRTVNGTPKQEGVFEHNPNAPAPPKPSRKARAKAAKMKAAEPVIPGAPPEKKRRLVLNGRSRTGCMTCRSRRLKCDETRPICINCSKSRRDCDYTKSMPRKDSQPSPAAPQPQAPAPESIILNAGPGDGHDWQQISTPVVSQSSMYGDVQLPAIMGVDERFLRMLAPQPIP